MTGQALYSSQGLHRKAAYVLFASLLAAALIHLSGLAYGVFVILFCAAVTFFLLAFESRTRFRRVYISLCIIFLLLAIGEAGALIGDRLKPHQGAYVAYNGYSVGYWSMDPVLGHAPSGPQEIRSVKRDGDRIIYDVTYSIDPQGLRATPSNPRGQCSFLFFGGSFVFGEGLNNEETLPYHFSRALDSTAHVLNFGFQGYGPHQMLKSLERGDPGRVTSRPVGAVFYVWRPGHAFRSMGLTAWNRFDPRFVIDAHNIAQPGGTYNMPLTDNGFDLLEKENLLPIIRNSTLFTLIYGFPETSQDTSRDTAINRLVSIVSTSRDLVQTLFDAPLFIIAWPDESEISRLTLESMKKNNLTVIDKQELLVPELHDEFLIPYDGHPSNYANLVMAKALAHQHGTCP